VRIFIAFPTRICRALRLARRPSLVLLLSFFLSGALLCALLERGSGSVCHVRLLLPAVLYHSTTFAGVMTSRYAVQLLSQWRPVVRKLCAAFAIACALAGISTATDARSRGSNDAAQGTPPQSPAAFDVVEKSISDLQAAMRSGSVTSRQLVEAYLARIRKYDQGGPKINAL